MTNITEHHQNNYEKPSRKNPFIDTLVLIILSVLVYYLVLTFVVRPYVIPSESMEPTLHGCPGCVGDRIIVDKFSYRFSSPQPGDVIVFRGPSNWNTHYHSIRSSSPFWHHLQDALAKIGFVPPDENDLVKRVIAVGGQTIQCRSETGITVDGHRLTEPYLHASTLMVDPHAYPCLGAEFGPVTVPAGKLWVMGDNRTHSADSRLHCANILEDVRKQIFCTGDPEVGTIPVANVIGKVRFIIWPPPRWGKVLTVNPQAFSS